MHFFSVVCALRLWWISIDSSLHILSKATHHILPIIQCLWVALLDADKHAKKRKAAHVRCGWWPFKSFWMESNFPQSAQSVTSIRQITVHQIRPKTQHKHRTHHFHPPFLSTLHLVFFNITICDIFCIDIQISTELWVDLDEIHQLFIHGAYYIQCFASLPSGLSLD